MKESKALKNLSNNSEDVRKHVQEEVYSKYVNDTIQRFRLLTIVVAIGEFCLMIMDFQNDFFDQNPLNYLNLGAEIMLILCSTLVFFICNSFINKPGEHLRSKISMIVGYRIVIMFAILLFIFTDIHIRSTAIGTYMVFLFVMQITPAFKSRVNWIQFLVIGAFTVVNFALYVEKSTNFIFGTMVIFLCFAVSTDFLRGYFVRQLENYYLAEYNNDRYKKLSRQTIVALAGAVEAKDIYTNGHSQRVAEYSRMIAEKFGYSEDKCMEVYYIGQMHDIGKIGVHDTVINKRDRLTDEEFAEMKRHPVVGYEILKQITEFPGISEGARWHHERYDGKGYPDGLKGKDIPEIARIIAVADSYDAMTSNRSYRKAMPQAVVREQIETNAGTQFDPEMAAIMLKMIDEDKDYKLHE